MKDNNLRTGLWRLADPKISITSVASMAIGAALAAGHTAFSWTWLLVLGLAMLVLVLVPNLGHTVNGATRWLRLGVVNLQAQLTEPLGVLVLEGRSAGGHEEEG